MASIVPAREREFHRIWKISLSCAADDEMGQTKWKIAVESLVGPQLEATR